MNYETFLILQVLCRCGRTSYTYTLLSTFFPLHPAIRHCNISRPIQRARCHIRSYPRTQQPRIISPDLLRVMKRPDTPLLPRLWCSCCPCIKRQKERSQRACLRGLGAFNKGSGCGLKKQRMEGLACCCRSCQRAKNMMFSRGKGSAAISENTFRLTGVEMLANRSGSGESGIPALW